LPLVQKERLAAVSKRVVGICEKGSGLRWRVQLHNLSRQLSSGSRLPHRSGAIDQDGREVFKQVLEPLIS
jgi:hypothetical protein